MTSPDFQNQKKIEGEIPETSVENVAGSGITAPKSGPEFSIAETIMHKAMEMAVVHVNTFRGENNSEEWARVKDELRALVDAAIAPVTDKKTAIMLEGVETFYRGGELHLVRATVGAVLERADDIEFHYDKAGDTIRLTLNLDAQRTLWDRVSLESSLDKDDNGATTITYTLTPKNKENPA